MRVGEDDRVGPVQPLGLVHDVVALLVVLMSVVEDKMQRRGFVRGIVVGSFGRIPGSGGWMIGERPVQDPSVNDYSVRGAHALQALWAATPSPVYWTDKGWTLAGRLQTRKPTT
jgi:hypothetical protein